MEWYLCIRAYSLPVRDLHIDRGIAEICGLVKLVTQTSTISIWSSWTISYILDV